ncbi:MAG: thioredoxin [Ruminococcaceae bacterium]|nr:thioredoxin [Oscillospiraceae bacterium]
MAVNGYLIKKWVRMLRGKSILHVNQGLGTQMDVSQIRGYYNDLTEKVIRDEANVSNVSYIPQFETASGECVYFPVMIFQYALGCYDLYLETSDTLYLEKFKTCVNWTMEAQNENGSFDAFSFMYADAPYGAMCQGEAVSVLLRAYVSTGEERYRTAAQKAVDFMLLSVEEGGTARYDGEDVYLLEYTHLPVVLNGWLFAFFGLYDYTLVSKEEKYREILQKTLRTMEKSLPQYDNGYWTMYDLGGKIASPFYHNLHIAQLQAAVLITDSETAKQFEKKWLLYQKSFWNPKRAFIKKAIQKILE